MLYWLTESVLADIRNAAMDQGSMWELANELMLTGDVDRATALRQNADGTTFKQEMKWKKIDLMAGPLHQRRLDIRRRTGAPLAV